MHFGQADKAWIAQLDFDIAGGGVDRKVGGDPRNAIITKVRPRGAIGRDLQIKVVQPFATTVGAVPQVNVADLVDALQIHLPPGRVILIPSGERATAVVAVGIAINRLGCRAAIRVVGAGLRGRFVQGDVAARPRLACTLDGKAIGGHGAGVGTAQRGRARTRHTGVAAPSGGRGQHGRRRGDEPAEQH